MAKVSVIIPAYNAEHFICEAIDSILAQTYNDYEIVVVDDGSTDKTRELLKSYKDKIKYIHQTNSGHAAARNTAISCTTSKYIAFLDADDRSHIKRLENSVSVLDKDSSIGLVHGDAVCINEKGEELARFEREKRFLTNSTRNDLLLRKTLIICSTVMVRRDCIDLVGGFDENLTYLVGEDRELWIRLAPVSRIQFIPELFTYYRIGSGNTSRDLSKILEGGEYIVNKHCPAGIRGWFLRISTLGVLYRKLADWHVGRKQFRQAVWLYFRSLCIMPVNLKTWFHLVKALIKRCVSLRENL